MRKRARAKPVEDPAAAANSPFQFFDSYAAPLFVWILIQLLALLSAATRVKLWARFGSVGETYALDQLIVAQFLGSTLLFPFLCRSAQAAIALILSSFPFIALAGYLSATPAMRCGAIALNLAIWLAGLGVWRKVANRAPVDLIGVAVLGAINIDGVALAYASLEVQHTWPAWAIAVPVIAAVEIPHSATLLAFVPAASVLLLAFAASRLFAVSLSTAVVH